MTKATFTFIALLLLLGKSSQADAVPILPLQFSPVAVQFGTVTLGDTQGADSPVTLRLRDTEAPFGPIRIQLSDPGHFEVISDSCSGTTLSGNAECQVSTSFSPDLFGHYSSFLVIMDEAGNLGNFVPLEGTGAEGAFPGPPGPVAGDTSVSDSTVLLDFGTQATGILSAGKGVTLINTGSTDLRVEATTFGGDAPFNFARIDACAPQLVPPGGTCAITAYFTPVQGDPAEATLAVSANVPNAPLLIALTGNGASSGLTPSGGGCSLNGASQALQMPSLLILVYSLLVLLGIRRLQ